MHDRKSPERKIQAINALYGSDQTMESIKMGLGMNSQTKKSSVASGQTRRIDSFAINEA